MARTPSTRIGGRASNWVVQGMKRVTVDLEAESDMPTAAAQVDISSAAIVRSSAMVEMSMS